jgi:hypothetical protein
MHAPLTNQLQKICTRLLCTKCFHQLVTANAAIWEFILVAESQKVWEVLHFSEHADPQLQSLSSQVSCSVVSAVLRVNGHRLWPQQPEAALLVQPLLRVSLQYVCEGLKILNWFCLKKGLKGESAVSCHQTLAALAACLPALLLSHESKLALPLLHALPRHKLNPYWLVKVQHFF